jgi:hypothetical protein
MHSLYKVQILLQKHYIYFFLHDWLDYITVETAAQAIVGCGISNNNAVNLTSKPHFNNINILHLGPWYSYNHFP